MSLTVDTGAASIAVTSVSTKNITLSSSGTNRVIVIGIGSTAANNSTDISASGVTSTHLTFKKLGQNKFTTSNSKNACLEVWIAPAAAQLSSEVITVNYNGTVSTGNIIAAAVAGFDANQINSPVDSNANSNPPLFSDDVSGSATQVKNTSGFSTDETNTIIITMTTNNDSVTPSAPTVGGTWTLLKGSGNLPTEFNSYYRVESAAQSGITVGWGTTNPNNWGDIVFALTINVNGAWASTEAADTFAGSGYASPNGPWASTETADAANFAVTVPCVATWASTETTDTLSFTVETTPFGTWASTEAADTFAGSVADINMQMNPTEAPDVWASSGYASPHGSWASTEAADAMSFLGATGQNGWASTEATDVWASSGYASPNGPWASTETADAFSGSGAAPPTGTWHSTEAADVAAFAVDDIVGGFNPTEAADVFAGAGSVSFIVTLHPTESADLFAGTGVVAAAAKWQSTEAPDRFVAAGKHGVAGTWASTEGLDKFLAVGYGKITLTMSHTEATDRFTAIGFGGPANAAWASTEVPDRFRALGAGAQPVIKPRRVLLVT